MATSIEMATPDTGATTQLAKPASVEKIESLKRRHDLDALRAVAMLLGIVLHAALSFAPIPWTVADVQQSNFYYVLFAAIHGFRMPLFFLISGLFTAMLWRRRGLSGLFKQRLIRIVLPLIAGCLTIVPAMWAVSILASQTSSDSEEINFFDAVAVGDTVTVQRGIESDKISIDALDPKSGASLLTVATFCGQPETVEMLLNLGADPNQKNRDAGTPLHVAVFMGRAESAKLLLEAGAKANTVDGNGNSPKDNLNIDFASTNFIAQMYGQTLDEESLKSNRAKIAKLLGQDQEHAAAAAASKGGLDALLFQFPVFMHLWFLAFLCWLIVAFAGYCLVANVMNFRRFPKWLFCSPFSLFWLVPLTMIPQHFMTPAAFGPDASIGLLPIPAVLGYYAIFFFFGAVYWELDDNDGLLGKWWYVLLPLAILIVFPLALELVSGTFGFLTDDFAGSMKPLLGNGLQALFAWLMVFGSIGMFRALFSGENAKLRYLSDSSYWLYLAHLPLVILAQWFVRDMPIPATIKFIGIIVLVSAFLFLTYEYLIRYTIIGTVLNGPRERRRSAVSTTG